MLPLKTKAPDFALPDQNGEMHTLGEYAGKKLLLYFYAKDNTLGCTKQAVAYSALKDKFLERGIVVVGVSKDTVASHKNFEAKQNLTITLLSDVDRSVIEAYDVWGEKVNCGKTCMGVIRTTYLIDENGVIVFANNKVKAAEDAEKMLITNWEYSLQ